MYVCMNVCMYECMYVCIYASMYTRMIAISIGLKICMFNRMNTVRKNKSLTLKKKNSLHVFQMNRFCVRITIRSGT